MRACVRACERASECVRACVRACAVVELLILEFYCVTFIAMFRTHVFGRVVTLGHVLEQGSYSW